MSFTIITIGDKSLIDVTIVKIEPELLSTQFEDILPLISKEKMEQVRKYRFLMDRQNSLVGDVVSRIEICKRSGLNNATLSFGKNKYGKPFLKNNADIYFNISHSLNYVAVAIDDTPVGIDIEEVKEVDLKIADRFFAPDELAYVLCVDRQRATERFFEVWTKKESNIKWEGLGLSKPLPLFSVFSNNENPKLYYHKVFEDERMISCLCSTKGEAPTVRYIETQELIYEANLLRR